MGLVLGGEGGGEGLLCLARFDGKVSDLVFWVREYFWGSLFTTKQWGKGYPGYPDPEDVASWGCRLESA